jgi:dienelactone hydrolase
MIGTGTFKGRQWKKNVAARSTMISAFHLESDDDRSEGEMTVPSMIKAIIAMTSALVAAALVAGPPAGGTKSEVGRPRPDGPLFLDVFLTRDAAVVTKPVEWVSAVGEQRGWLVRPPSDERLPALLLIASGRTNDFFLQSARDLAGIGYAVLLVRLERNQMGAPAGTAQAKQSDALLRERALAQLCSAARWMRRRDDVFPDKVGVLGWGNTARWALELAAAQDLQAAVLTDAELPLVIDAPLSIGLRHTAVLIVRGTSEATQLDGELVARLERAFGSAHVEHRVLEFKKAKTGFMDGRRRDAFDAKSADHAWFEIYEFLGKHVEDAELKSPPMAGRNWNDAQSARPFVSIGDVMRAVNAPSGVRGSAAQSLGEAPRDEKDWKLLRARAAIMADSGVLLMGLKPPRGGAASWQRHAASYRDAAAALVNAADRRNLADARQAFDRLNTSCGRCHSDHR